MNDTRCDKHKRIIPTDGSRMPTNKLTFLCVAVTTTEVETLLSPIVSGAVSDDYWRPPLQVVVAQVVVAITISVYIL